MYRCTHAYGSELCAAAVHLLLAARRYFRRTTAISQTYYANARFKRKGESRQTYIYTHTNTCMYVQMLDAHKAEDAQANATSLH